MHGSASSALRSHSCVSVLLLGSDDRGTVYRRGKQTTDSPDHTGTVKFRWEGPEREHPQSLSNLIELTVVEMAPPR